MKPPLSTWGTVWRVLVAIPLAYVSMMVSVMQFVAVVAVAARVTGGMNSASYHDLSALLTLLGLVVFGGYIWLYIWVFVRLDRDRAFTFQPYAGPNPGSEPS